MASKTGRKANQFGKKGKSNAPVEKDDGTRWTVHDHKTGQQVYGGTGVTRGQAERLATGLVAPSEIRLVSSDG